jgi:hypothetical protein
MDKVKDKLHIGSKRKEEKAAALAADNGDAADQGMYYVTVLCGEVRGTLPPA